MVSVLLVEDDSATLQQWEAMFKTFLPDARILTATTAVECRHVIESCKEAKQLIEIVVLDAMIPQDLGTVATVDVKLASDIGVAYPRALIIHCTAYSDDSDVKRRLEGELSRLDTGRHLLVNKGPIEYCDTIERLCMQHLFEPSIYRRMTLLFGPTPSNVRQAGNDLSCVTGGYHATRELSALMTDIRLSWRHLSPNYHEWIREHISITNDDDGHILISLFPESMSNEKLDPDNEPCLYPKDQIVTG